MKSPPPITYSADADRIGWLVFDDPETRVNVFGAGAQAALADALTAAERDAVRAVIITSGKENVFTAGADLKQVAGLRDAASATEFSRAGQRLFQRVTTFRVPVVCAIHGPCAGGGFELALACHWRVVSDSPATRVGLPETSIGAIPGWGGCVRLPRLIGAKPALDHILRGQLIGPAEALAAGLVHERVPVAELRTRAKAAAIKLAGEGRPAMPSPPAPAILALLELRTAVLAKTREQLPALLAAIDVVERSDQLGIDEALEIEARAFGEIVTGKVCRNLVHVFFLRDAARKRTLEGWFKGRAPSVSSPARRIGVVGAGVMGSGIAHWLALHGFDVVLRDVQPEFINRGLATIRGLFDEAVRRSRLPAGAADAALHRIATTTAWEGFATCDLVVEAIVENAPAKRALFTELAKVVSHDAMLVSNTSALPIEQIAAHVPNPSRTLGLHFFNPVGRMPLVELIIGEQTSVEAAERALSLVKALGKSPVICRSSPGFLVTRVLFFYLNEAVRQWEQGWPIESLDGVMREFGWPMGPLRLIDEVGIDVTDFIFGEMEHYFPTRFRRSHACARLLAAGLKGRKGGAGRGFYRYEAKNETANDVETRRVFEAAGDANRSPARKSPPSLPSEICESLMRVMVDEAERCVTEGVVKSADDVDFALLSGAGFPAFRGGLLRWAHSERATTLHRME